MRAADRPRCTCGQFLHPNKPCGRPGKKPTPVLDRILLKTTVLGEDDCWPWTGHTTVGGYARIDDQYVNRVLTSAQKGQQVRHKCDNPPCCNPKHLVLGTSADNHQDMVERGRSNRGEKHWNWKGGKSKNYRLGSNRKYVLL